MLLTFYQQIAHSSNDHSITRQTLVPKVVCQNHNPVNSQRIKITVESTAVNFKVR